MGKTHQALKQAEKEYVNRQQQNILVSRQKFSRKWNFYSTLAVLLIAIGRISYYWGTRLQASLTANANDSVETAAGSAGGKFDAPWWSHFSMWLILG